jgi:hypothetical protein
VHDLAFYNAGCHEARGARRVLVAVRRLLRRLLRPIFLRQVELFQGLINRLDAGEQSVQAVRDDVESLARRQDEVDERVETALAIGWDHVAMVRRLAVLEDQLATLTGQAAPSAVESDPQPSILFPSLDTASETRSKVC